jgi:hypothetical protein
MAKQMTQTVSGTEQTTSANHVYIRRVLRLGAKGWPIIEFMSSELTIIILKKFFWNVLTTMLRKRPLTSWLTGTTWSYGSMSAWWQGSLASRSDAVSTRGGYSSIPRQLPPTPLCVLPRRVELPLDMTIQRPHHSYPREHRRAVALSNQQ